MDDGLTRREALGMLGGAVAGGPVPSGRHGGAPHRRRAIARARSSCRAAP